MSLQNASWGLNWAWGTAIIVLTVVIHVCGMGLIYQRAIRLARSGATSRWPMSLFLLRLVGAVLLATFLGGFEAAVWAGAYIHLGAISGQRDAMLYSLDALATYGHTGRMLSADWRLMGALEALNGTMLLGLTAAFLFAIIQRIMPSSRRRGGRPG